MISLSGKTHLKIDYIGLQKGEKLYEELLFNEDDEKTEFESIVIAKEKDYDFDRLDGQINELVKSQDINSQRDKLWGIINGELNSL